MKYLIALALLISVAIPVRAQTIDPRHNHPRSVEFYRRIVPSWIDPAGMCRNADQLRECLNLLYDRTPSSFLLPGVNPNWKEMDKKEDAE